jgi:isoleucyl-tRNA synthetase
LALKAIKQVRWMPKWGQARIEGMVGNRPDWCISRQRTWGVPITLFIHKSTGKLHPETRRLIEEVAQRVEASGIDAWFDLDAADLLGEASGEYEKVMDTLDVWFDSGVTHYCVLKQDDQLSFPADLYLEGSDQHRGWFQSSLLTSIGMDGVAPYKSVLTHGFTVDAQGRKMSKSLGNVIAPQKVVNTLGADIIRLWVAATDYSGEMGVSDVILKRMSDAYRRIRNTARFLLANLNGFEPQSHMLESSEMLVLDRWIVDRARQLQGDIRSAYEDYEFHLIYQKIHNFCTVDMGSFYLDIIKDRQYTTRADGIPRRSAQTAMYHIIEALVRWLAPVLSFTAEDIWQHIPGEHEESVFLEAWYEPVVRFDANLSSSGMDREFWDRVLDVREAVSRELERLRVAGEIGSSLDAEIDLYCDRELYNELAKLDDELRFVLITSYARIHPLEPRPDDAVEAALSSAESIWVVVKPSAYQKCVRCWHHREDVGSNSRHPQLCGRCVLNVTGEGEIRRFA